MYNIYFQIIIAGMFILTIINTAFRYQELRYHVTLNERAFESFDKLKTASEFKENLQHFDHGKNFARCIIFIQLLILN